MAYVICVKTYHAGNLRIFRTRCQSCAGTWLLGSVSKESQKYLINETSTTSKDSHTYT